MLCLLQPFFSQNLSHWLLEEWNDKSSNADSKNTLSVLSSCCPFEKNVLSNVCLGFLWRRRYFGKCESLGSSPVKMSQAFHDPFTVAGQRLASSRLFWPATGPYWQHWKLDWVPIRSPTHQKILLIPEAPSHSVHVHVHITKTKQIAKGITIQKV